MKKEDLPQVALLEDNPDLLRFLKELLEDNNIAKVVIFSQDATDFIEKVRKIRNDSLILLLDIELDNQSSTGIDVATMFKLPIIFVSGKTKEYLDGIQTIKLDSHFPIPVELVLKPITKERIEKILFKISNEIAQIKKPKHKMISFDFDGIQKQKNQDTIVFLESESDSSNNKKIYFMDEKPLTLHNFTFSKMLEKGYAEEFFIKPHRSYRVNKQHVKQYDSKSHQLIVTYQDKNGKKVDKSISVSENNRSIIRKHFQ